MRRTSRPTDVPAGPPQPGNLPHELNRFVGRGAELTALTAALESGRLVTVTGVGGVGKSRFAAHAAARVPRSLCPDGVWRVELATVRLPELVEYTLAEALGLTDHTTRAPRQVLVDHLAERRLRPRARRVRTPRRGVRLSHTGPAARGAGAPRDRGGPQTAHRRRGAGVPAGAADTGRRGGAVRGPGHGAAARVPAGRADAGRRPGGVSPPRLSAARGGARGRAAAGAVAAAADGAARRPVPAVARWRQGRTAAPPDAAHHDRLEP